MKKSEKLKAILRALSIYAEYHKGLDGYNLGERLNQCTVIKRKALRLKIIGELGIVDAHTINNWIDRLTAIRAIENARKTVKFGKPNNDTIYIVNEDVIAYQLKQIDKQLKPKTQTDTYTNPTELRELYQLCQKETSESQNSAKDKRSKVSQKAITAIHD